MKEEIQSLRMRIAEQEEVLQNTIQRLRSTSRTKESMETFIVSQRQSRTTSTLFIAIAIAHQLRIITQIYMIKYGSGINSTHRQPLCTYWNIMV